MNTEDVLNEFRDAGALREGHFVLSSGLHSPVFLQKNLVFMDGAPAVFLDSLTKHNGECPNAEGATISPSQVKVSVAP